MFMLTLNYVPGANIQALGLCKGNVVQSKHLGKDFMAGMKNLVGGEIESYTEMLVEAREIATKRMLDNAASMLKAGGVLVYSTCTLLKEENEGQILAFLQRHPEFEEQDLQQYFPEDAGSFNRHLTLWPEENGHDGFFIALLTKKKQD